MKRTIVWISVALSVIVVLVAGIILAIKYSQPRLLGGPVVIVQGDPPEHGFLGIDFQPESTDILKVKSVVPGSGTDQAGILPGDVLVAMEGKTPSTVKDVLHILQDKKPDSTVRITIRRDDVEQEMNVRLISFKELILLQGPPRMEVQVP